MRRRPQGGITHLNAHHLITPQKTPVHNQLLGFTYTRHGSVTRADEISNIPQFSLPNFNLGAGDDEEDDGLFDQDNDGRGEMDIEVTDDEESDMVM